MSGAVTVSNESTTSLLIITLLPHLYCMFGRFLRLKVTHHAGFMVSLAGSGVWVQARMPTSSTLFQMCFSVISADSFQPECVSSRQQATGCFLKNCSLRHKCTSFLFSLTFDLKTYSCIKRSWGTSWSMFSSFIILILSLSPGSSI